MAVTFTVAPFFAVISQAAVAETSKQLGKKKKKKKNEINNPFIKIIILI
jgi:hypothetical protein